MPSAAPAALLPLSGRLDVDLLDLTEVCDDASCGDAVSHADLCTCRCGGLGHSWKHRDAMRAGRDAIRARLDKDGFTTAMHAALLGDSPF